MQKKIVCFLGIKNRWRTSGRGVSPTSLIVNMPVASRELKIVVLGTGGVGKSALSVQYVQSIFVEKYDPTIEDSYRKVVDVPTSWLSGAPLGTSHALSSAANTSTAHGMQTTSIVLEIMDTAGTDQFVAMRDLYMRNGDAFLIVYAIDSLASFEALLPMYDQLLRVRNATPGSVPVLLVGNKCDLESQRQVSRQQAQALASRWQIPPPVETSARKNLNVSNTFMQLVEMTLTTKHPHTSSPADPTVRAKSQKGRGKAKKNCIIL